MERVNEETGAKLAAYLMNELDAEGRAEVEALLAASPEAREELDELRGAFQFLAGEMAEKRAAPALAAARVEAIKNSAEAMARGGTDGNGGGANGSSARVVAVAPKRRITRTRWLGYAAAASAAGVLTWVAVENGLEHQVRSKVARVKSDQRSLATSLESYYAEPAAGAVEPQAYQLLDRIRTGRDRRSTQEFELLQKQEQRASDLAHESAPPATLQGPPKMIVHGESRRLRTDELAALPQISSSAPQAAPAQPADGAAIASVPPQATPAAPGADRLARSRRSSSVRDRGELEKLEEGIAAGRSVQLGAEFKSTAPKEVADASARRLIRDRYYYDFEPGSGSYIVEEGPPAPPAAAPRDMFFQNYGVNPFIDADEDPESTFAIDVDTASYTIVRNYLNGGTLPPPEAVRVEEIVNYLPNPYAAPERQTFAVYSDVAPSPFRKGHHILKVGIKGRELPRSERKPLVLTLVVDISGSMAQGNRIELVRETIRRLTAQLRPEDRLGMVLYQTSARTVLKGTSATDRDTVEYALAQLQPSGSTNAEAGLRLGYELARGIFNRNASNRVILLSDGVANVGQTGPEAILREIAEDAGRKIYLTAIGVGMGNYNDVLLEQLADQGNGNYAYLDSFEEIHDYVDRKFIRSFQVIAQDMKVQVEFDASAVAEYRLLGYENRAVPDSQFRNGRIDAGEIGSGHAATALYEVKLREGASGRAATVRLRFARPDAGMGVQEISGEISVDAARRTFGAADEHTKLVAIAAQYADILRRSHWARGSSMADVERAFTEAGLRQSGNAAAGELLGLIQAAERLTPAWHEEWAEEREPESAPSAPGGQRIPMR